MNASFRKLVLTAHVSSSVATMGAVAGFLALALVGLSGSDQTAAASAYRSMEIIAWAVILPLIVASLVTGLVQSLGSEWGLFRHYWIVAKLGINLVATVVLLLHMQPIGILARAAEKQAMIDGSLSKLQIQLVANAGAALLVLLVATALSVYKPRGLTPYGQKATRHGRSAVSDTPPTWTKVLGWMVAAIVVTVLLLHLAGIGFGPH